MGRSRRDQSFCALHPILTMMTSMPTDRRNVMWFIAWMLTGAGFALGILGALSIGPYVLVITVAAAIVLATRTGSRVGLPGLISGLSPTVLRCVLEPIGAWNGLHLDRYEPILFG
jgi:hypothetical protein